jgi:ATP-dependent Clp protease adaptor protein ClpS
MITMKEKPEIGKNTNSELERNCDLILFNDDIHSFEYVIESLVEVCSMNSIQAEQCTYIAHYKGKCNVRKGTFGELKPMKDRLIEKELICSIH